MQGNSYFNFLALNKSLKIRVNQAATHWIDLAIVEHHLTGAEPLNVEREDGISSSFRSQNGCQVA